MQIEDQVNGSVVDLIQQDKTDTVSLGEKSLGDTRSYHENEKDQIARERRKRRRKKGKLPLKERDSVLERLRKYQEKIRRARLP